MTDATILPTVEKDPYLFLEELNEETAAWARERSDASLRNFAGKRFDRHLAESDAILSAKDKLVLGTRRGDYVYSFFTDGEHPRGLWRRTTKQSYDAYTGPETEPDWEVLLDIGALGQAEGQSWVYGGMRINHDGFDRALLTLKPGGSDASVIREFDLVTKEFVEDGFIKPLGKGEVRWLNRDTVLLAHDFKGHTTRAGYPASVRLWRRGQGLDEAQILLQGQEEDMAVGGQNFNLKDFEKTVLYRARNFRTFELFDMDRSSYQLTRLQVPPSAVSEPVRDWLLVLLREPWQVEGRTFTAGSLLALPYREAKTGPHAQSIRTIYQPGPETSLLSYTAVKNGIYFTVLDRVRTRLYFAEDSASGWITHELTPNIGDFNQISVQPINPETRNGVNLIVSGFLTPSTLYRASFREDNFSPENFWVRQVRSAPARFDSSGLEVRQRWARSEDGTQVPYFVVGKAEALDGVVPAPTLLTAYGGFQVSKTPAYSGLYGKGLLEKGYVYALANIRGGGEFGPAWHQAALKQNRGRSYEDFAAVARDLVEAGITTVPQLAALGGSNGGLLMGNMYTRYPHLFGAIVCQVPLLDMKRYSHLLAGASWVAEYGDPDTEDWDFIREFSAYHNVNPADIHPTMLLTTSTRDDRVHPGHARKFMALLEALGKPVHYFESAEGGHAGAADVKQSAYLYAMLFTYLDNAILP